MEPNPRRKSEGARWANHVIRSRTHLLMLVLGVVTFGLLIWKLYDLQIVQHDALQAKAASQQTRSAVVTASRGTIYDASRNILAISATAETVNISPKEIIDFVEKQEKDIEEAREKALKQGKPYTAPRVRDQIYIARGLSRILELDQENILQKMENKSSMYVELKKKVDQTTADEVRCFINGEIDEEGREVTEHKKRLQGVWMNPDSKRYYPYGSVASSVLGFVNGDNKGGVGLESKYDSVLTGTSGMTITAKDNRNQPLLFQYEQYYDAENGHDLVLTLDITVQSYLEAGVEAMVKKFDAKNGGTGIIIDVNSGAIKAMASYPDYDLNSFGTVYTEELQQKLEAQLADIDAKRSTYETEEEYEAARATARTNILQMQWRNKCIDSRYEPGSTFKPITLSSVLEEGLVDMNSSFVCNGSVMVPGWKSPFYCSNHNGHGTQSLQVATGNSCNPAFINMGMRIGTQKYYQYLQAFGLMENTGVDMIGEVHGQFANEKDFCSNVVSLASYSFGQTFTVTPLELVRAQAATVNGGYLYTPYIVEQVLDENGSVVQQHDATPVRQVISEETSAKVRQCLEYVVASGTGKNGQVAGYRIGGKTGTADKTGTRTASNPKGDIVVSFMCFAPADDPKYLMLLTLDTPSRTTGTYPSGGNMVAPTASQVMAEVLPYLGIQPEYTAAELADIDVAVPYVVGSTLEEAKLILSEAGFTCRTVGDGDTVTDQTPAGGAIVPNSAGIILYLGAEKPDKVCVMPNVIGMTASEANKAITNAGLILKITGSTSASSGNAFAISQEVEAGTELQAGDVVMVQFGSHSSGAD